MRCFAFAISERQQLVRLRLRITVNLVREGRLPTKPYENCRPTDENVTRRRPHAPQTKHAVAGCHAHIEQVGAVERQQSSSRSPASKKKNNGREEKTKEQKLDFKRERGGSQGDLLSSATF